jgi:hypothetical protein
MLTFPPPIYSSPLNTPEIPSGTAKYLSALRERERDREREREREGGREEERERERERENNRKC